MGRGLASTSCFLRSQAMAEVLYIVRCMMATMWNIFSTGGILVAFNALEMIKMTSFIPLPCVATIYQSGRVLVGERGAGKEEWLHENQSGFQSRPDAATGQGVGVSHWWRQVAGCPDDGVQQGGDPCLR